MKRDLMISTPARRYARALVEVAIKQRNFSAVFEELEAFRHQLEALPLLEQLFLNPAVPQAKKKNILDQLGRKQALQPLTINFLLTLMRRGRFRLLEQILASAEQQFLERQGITVVEVATARALQPHEEKQLIARLEAFTGKKVRLENRIDRSLIGGVVTRIGSTLYDGSVQAQLMQLKARIQEA
jgi:F-type H+-transporting ATPase subunit delta